jgi:hypothetical protein
VLGDAHFVEAALLRYDTALEKDPRNHHAHLALAKAHLELVCPCVCMRAVRAGVYMHLHACMRVCVYVCMYVCVCMYA